MHKAIVPGPVPCPGPGPGPVQCEWAIRAEKHLHGYMAELVDQMGTACRFFHSFILQNIAIGVQNQM